MIYCNLSVLLAERRLKISSVSADTHISRTTLTALCQNAMKGVQTDTINELCMYLNIGVGDLFSFYPFDISVSDCVYFSTDGTAELVFDYSSRQYCGEIRCTAEINIGSYKYPDRGCYASISLQEYDPETTQDSFTNGLIRSAFKSMPVSIVDALKGEIADMVIRSLTYESNVEIDGEVYGYPEAASEWETDVTLPAAWAKEK